MEDAAQWFLCPWGRPEVLLCPTGEGHGTEQIWEFGLKDEVWGATSTWNLIWERLSVVGRHCLALYVFYNLGQTHCQIVLTSANFFIGWDFQPYPQGQRGCSYMALVGRAVLLFVICVCSECVCGGGGAGAPSLGSIGNGCRSEFSHLCPPSWAPTSQ